MAITTISLIRLPTSAKAQITGVRVTTLEDALLLHTDLDFADDPDELAAEVRAGLGEELAAQHADERGLFLIPSVAAPKARTYAGVIDEVADGGVWGAWEELEEEQDEPDLSGLFNQMLGSMSPGLLGAAAQLRADPSALKDASAQLPDLLNSPGGLEQLMAGMSAQMPELSHMLRGLGIDLASPEMQRMSQELARDPNQLAKLAESMFGAQAADEDDEEVDDDEEAPAKKP